MATETATAAKVATGRRHLGWAPYALLAPSLVYLAVFFALPMVNAFGLAFQGDAGGYSLEPIRRMLGDERFTQAGILERPFIFLDYQHPTLLIMTIVVAEAWRANSILMIILVAGLQGIPRDYLEAADVFGATAWQRVRHVILPLLKPSIRVALILRTILAFQAFATVIALAGKAKELQGVLNSVKAPCWKPDPESSGTCQVG